MAEMTDWMNGMTVKSGMTGWLEWPDDRNDRKTKITGWPECRWPECRWPELLEWSDDRNCWNDRMTGMAGLPEWMEWPELAVWSEWPEWLRLWGSQKLLWDITSEITCIQIACLLQKSIKGDIEKWQALFFTSMHLKISMKSEFFIFDFLTYNTEQAVIHNWYTWRWQLY